MSSIRILRTFLAVARHGSFAAAGAEVGLTAAAVGLQMRSLERDFNRRLFDRGARTVVLTDAWHASGPYGSESHSVQSRVEAGSRVDPLHEAQFALGYQLTRWSLDLMDFAGLEPTAASFRAHYTDVDRVPADRIAP